MGEKKQQRSDSNENDVYEHTIMVKTIISFIHVTLRLLISEELDGIQFCPIEIHVYSIKAAEKNKDNNKTCDIIFFSTTSKIFIFV